MATLKFDRGTSFTIGVTYKKNGVPFSLIGATVRFTIKSVEFDSSPDDATAIVEKNITSGTEEGTANITLAPTDTDDVTPGNYYYDIKVDEQSNGETVYKIDEGRVKLGGSPTNRLSS